jgi:hypothetical protein
VFCPWPTPDLVLTVHNSSSALPRLAGKDCAGGFSLVYTIIIFFC